MAIPIKTNVLSPPCRHWKVTIWEHGRKEPYMQGLPRHLITYCQYGFKYRKATDIWTNHPNPKFKPACKNGDPCHVKAPRGTKLGLQAIHNRATRSKYPPNYASTSWTSAKSTSSAIPCRSNGSSEAVAVS